MSAEIFYNGWPHGESNPLLWLCYYHDMPVATHTYHNKYHNLGKSTFHSFSALCGSKTWLLLTFCRTWWSSWTPMVQNALWCCSSPPGASSPPALPLTSTHCHGSSPACISWHWMPLSTAGTWSELRPLHKMKTEAYDELVAFCTPHVMPTS